MSRPPICQHCSTRVCGTDGWCSQCRRKRDAIPPLEKHPPDVYPCANKHCDGRIPVPAKHLRWIAPGLNWCSAGWYCVLCRDRYPLPATHANGEPLDAFLNMKPPQATNPYRVFVRTLDHRAVPLCDRPRKTDAQAVIDAMHAVGVTGYMVELTT